jgi:hypothetical protein
MENEPITNEEWSANQLTERIVREYFTILPKNDIEHIWQYIRNYIMYQQEISQSRQTSTPVAAIQQRPLTPIPPTTIETTQSNNNEKSDDSDSEMEYDSDEPPCAIVNTSDEERAYNRLEPEPILPWKPHLIDSQDVYLQTRDLYEHYIPHEPFVGFYQFYMDIFHNN